MSRLTAPEFIVPDLQPDVDYDVRTDVWTLRHDWSYHDALQDVTVCVPAGFGFDLASIPRPLQGIIPKFKLSIAAPLAHDWLYRTRGVARLTSFDLARGVEVTDEIPWYTREEADDLFRRLMAEAGVPKLRRVAAWLAVRAFGGRAWGSERVA